MKHYHTTVSPVARALPEFLAKTGYKDTSDPANCAFQLAWQTDKPAYGGWGPEDKSLIPAFTAFMTAQRATQASWTSTFPMQNLCLSEEDAAHDRVLFVDVGGSAGHQCQSLRASHPDLKGRVVLQDVAGVIARLDTAALAEQGIEAAAHDFFTPQPPSVRGAKAFYLRNVLHDWPSPTCVEILQHLREACAEDSVVLIDEVVVRDEAGGKGWMGAQKDVQMLACTAGRERSLREWEELVQTADLRVREVVGYGGQGDGIVVCVPI